MNKETCRACTIEDEDGDQIPMEYHTCCGGKWPEGDSDSDELC